MDIPTDSDYSEDDARSTSHNIDVKNEPAHVTWRGTSGNTESLAELQLGLAYRANNHKTLIKFQTSTKLKKGPAKPALFLFIDPKEIESLDYLSDDEDGLDEQELEQAGLARDKLNTKPESRKRRRRSSSLGLDQNVDIRHDADGAVNIMQMLLELQKTVDAGRTAQDAALAKILAKVDTIESRLGQLEAQQRDLSQEVETQIEAQVEPLWDELSARLQSQEDREHDYIRDMIEESFEEKIDDKIPEAVDQYLKSNEDGQALAADIVNERIREETRAFLRTQQFTGHFTIADEK
ncbi:hypothetical protein LQW54_010841 [Pestalotiopsis sp. IQ-011]